MYSPALVQAAAPAYSNFWEVCSETPPALGTDPPRVRSPLHLVLEQKQVLD